MLKHFLIGLGVVLMMGFNLGCEQPSEGPGNGGGYEQPQQEDNPYEEQQPDKQESGGFD